MTDQTWEPMNELKKRKKIKLLLCIFLLLLYSKAFSQNTPNEISVLFYNVENLFDIKNDPLTSDDEFTPKGDRRWTYKRFLKKLNDLSKVLLNVSGWYPPELIALCEVENRYVLEKLLNDTPLQRFPYKIIHKESPDPRGIDVALLYNNEQFYPLEYQYFPLKNQDDSDIRTREILYVSGIVNKSDTIHLFANHWPSRYSGLLESQSLRNLAARTLRNQIEILHKNHPNPKIIIVGDFNDQPTDESLSLHLDAKNISESESDIIPDTRKLYNLSYPWMEDETGTLKYQSQWSVFDQIIVSGSLLNTEGSIFTKPEWAQIVKLPFLFENDERYGGQKTNRTYNGFRYQGGFSDHLPILLKLRFNH